MKMRNIVLVGLMVLLASAFVAYGVPSFTPVVDGNKDAGWGPVPDHSTNTSKNPTSFNLVGGCFVTDDSADVYIGIPTDIAPYPPNGCAMHVLIDLRNTAAGANTESYGACAVGYDMPYLAEYDIAAEWATGAITYANKCTWGGTSWTSYVPIHGTGAIAGGGGLFTEIRLPRNEYDGLAQGDTINISIWLRPEHFYGGGSNNANACLPADADFPTDSGYAACDPDHYFSVQFFYKIQTALVDTRPPQVVSATQAGADKVIVEFDEFMDQTTLVFGNFTIDGGLTFNASQVLSGTSVLLTADANFTASTLYTVTASSSVKDVAQNSVDPAYDTGSFTAVAYALMTFVYVDQNADLTAPHCKGSFNNYGNYDPSWGVTPFPMYDDGTNGDTTASDSRWTGQFYLKPSATDTFGWGVTEGLGGDWAMECGDLKFQVLDATPGQAQIYTVGVYAPVTFRIDDSQDQSLTECWVKGTFNSIGRYEGAWSDFLQMYDDGAHNDVGAGDNIWGLTVNIVPDNYCHDSTWEWGAADAYNGNWLISGPNRQFAVPTSAPRIETYSIVTPTAQAVTVTFNVDMQFLLGIPLNIDSMAIAGGFNGWNNTATIMSDADVDSV
ncbi:Ig-like domain-containing protein, partial [bacterium]|nr:Ig-like domain-containing protein [bacterium]